MATVNLSIEGEITTEVKLFYGKQNKKPVCKFAIKHTYVHRNEMAEQWFNFITYDQLAEYIGEHYKRGDPIDIIRAMPSRDKMQRGNKTYWAAQWVIKEIGEVEDRTNEPVNIQQAEEDVPPPDEYDAPY